MTRLIWQYALYGLACYLLSNFNFAVFISKRFKHRDIRTVGSGNPGTTNMFRAFGLRTGLITFVCDMMKGFVCALGGRLLFGYVAESVGLTGAELENAALFGGYVGGLFAGLGHVFPVLFGFKGGKGFATGIGFFLAVDPLVAVMAIIVGSVVLLATDLMSPFAILFFTIMTLRSAISLLPDRWPHFVAVALYYAMVLFAHRHNIKRLYHGQENKMGIAKYFRKKDKEDEDDDNEKTDN